MTSLSSACKTFGTVITLVTAQLFIALSLYLISHIYTVTVAPVLISVLIIITISSTLWLFYSLRIRFSTRSLTTPTSTKTLSKSKHPLPSIHLPQLINQPQIKSISIPWFWVLAFLPSIMTILSLFHYFSPYTIGLFLMADITLLPILSILWSELSSTSIIWPFKRTGDRGKGGKAPKRGFFGIFKGLFNSCQSYLFLAIALTTLILFISLVISPQIMSESTSSVVTMAHSHHFGPKSEDEFGFFDPNPEQRLKNAQNTPNPQENYNYLSDLIIANGKVPGYVPKWLQWLLFDIKSSQNGGNGENDANSSQNVPNGTHFASFTPPHQATSPFLPIDSFLHQIHQIPTLPMLFESHSDQFDGVLSAFRYQNRQKWAQNDPIDSSKAPSALRPISLPHLTSFTSDDPTEFQFLPSFLTFLGQNLSVSGISLQFSHFLSKYLPHSILPSYYTSNNIDPEVKKASESLFPFQQRVVMSNIALILAVFVMVIYTPIILHSFVAFLHSNTDSDYYKDGLPLNLRDGVDGSAGDVIKDQNDGLLVHRPPSLNYSNLHNPTNNTLTLSKSSQNYNERIQSISMMMIISKIFKGITVITLICAVLVIFISPSTFHPDLSHSSIFNPFATLRSAQPSVTPIPFDTANDPYLTRVNNYFYPEITEGKNDQITSKNTKNEANVPKRVEKTPRKIIPYPPIPASLLPSLPSTPITSLFSYNTITSTLSFNPLFRSFDRATMATPLLPSTPSFDPRSAQSPFNKALQYSILLQDSIIATLPSLWLVGPVIGLVVFCVGMGIGLNLMLLTELFQQVNKKRSKVASTILQTTIVDNTHQISSIGNGKKNGSISDDGEITILSNKNYTLVTLVSFLFFISFFYFLPISPLIDSVTLPLSPNYNPDDGILYSNERTVWSELLGVLQEQLEHAVYVLPHEDFNTISTNLQQLQLSLSENPSITPSTQEYMYYSAIVDVVEKYYNMTEYATLLPKQVTFDIEEQLNSLIENKNLENFSKIHLQLSTILSSIYKIPLSELVSPSQNSPNFNNNPFNFSTELALPITKRMYFVSTTGYMNTIPVGMFILPILMIGVVLMGQNHHSNARKSQEMDKKYKKMKKMIINHIESTFSTLDFPSDAKNSDVDDDNNELIEAPFELPSLSLKKLQVITQSDPNTISLSHFFSTSYSIPLSPHPHQHVNSIYMSLYEVYAYVSINREELLHPIDFCFDIFKSTLLYYYPGLSSLPCMSPSNSHKNQYDSQGSGRYKQGGKNSSDDHFTKSKNNHSRSSSQPLSFKTVVVAIVTLPITLITSVFNMITGRKNRSKYQFLDDDDDDGDDDQNYHKKKGHNYDDDDDDDGNDPVHDLDTGLSTGSNFNNSRWFGLYSVLDGVLGLVGLSSGRNRGERGQYKKIKGPNTFFSSSSRSQSPFHNKFSRSGNGIPASSSFTSGFDDIDIDSDSDSASSDNDSWLESSRKHFSPSSEHSNDGNNTKGRGNGYNNVDLKELSGIEMTGVLSPKQESYFISSGSSDDDDDITQNDVYSPNNNGKHKNHNNRNSSKNDKKGKQKRNNKNNDDNSEDEYEVINPHNSSSRSTRSRSNQRTPVSVIPHSQSNTVLDYNTKGMKGNNERNSQMQNSDFMNNNENLSPNNISVGDLYGIPTNILETDLSSREMYNTDHKDHVGNHNHCHQGNDCDDNHCHNHHNSDDQHDFDHFDGDIDYFDPFTHLQHYETPLSTLDRQSKSVVIDSGHCHDDDHSTCDHSHSNYTHNHSHHGDNHSHRADNHSCSPHNHNNHSHSNHSHNSHSNDNNNLSMTSFQTQLSYNEPIVGQSTNNHGHSHNGSVCNGHHHHNDHHNHNHQNYHTNNKHNHSSQQHNHSQDTPNNDRSTQDTHGLIDPTHQALMELNSNHYNLRSLHKKSPTPLSNHLYKRITNRKMSGNDGKKNSMLDFDLSKSQKNQNVPQKYSNDYDGSLNSLLSNPNVLKSSDLALLPPYMLFTILTVLQTQQRIVNKKKQSLPQQPSQSSSPYQSTKQLSIPSEIDPTIPSLPLLQTALTEFTALLVFLTKNKSFGPISIYLSICILVMVLEFIVGIVSGSLGLIADSAHMLFDSLGIFLAILSSYLRYRQRAGNYRFSYGYVSIDSVAAAASATLLLCTGVWVIGEACMRLVVVVDFGWVFAIFRFLNDILSLFGLTSPSSSSSSSSSSAFPNVSLLIDPHNDHNHVHADSVMQITTVIGLIVNVIGVMAFHQHAHAHGSCNHNHGGGGDAHGDHGHSHGSGGCNHSNNNNDNNHDHSHRSNTHHHSNNHGHNHGSGKSSSCSDSHTHNTSCPSSHQHHHSSPTHHHSSTLPTPYPKSPIIDDDPFNDGGEVLQGGLIGTLSKDEIRRFNSSTNKHQTINNTNGHPFKLDAYGNLVPVIEEDDFSSQFEIDYDGAYLGQNGEKGTLLSPNTLKSSNSIKNQDSHNHNCSEHGHLHGGDGYHHWDLDNKTVMIVLMSNDVPIKFKFLKIYHSMTSFFRLMWAQCYISIFGHQDMSLTDWGMLLHLMADLLGSLALVISTLLTNWFDLKLADPLVSLFIAILIIISVVPLYQAIIDSVLFIPMGKDGGENGEGKWSDENDHHSDENDHHSRSTSKPHQHVRTTAPNLSPGIFNNLVNINYIDQLDEIICKQKNEFFKQNDKSSETEATKISQLKENIDGLNTNTNKSFCFYGDVNVIMSQNDSDYYRARGDGDGDMVEIIENELKLEQNNQNNTKRGQNGHVLTTNNILSSHPSSPHNQPTITHTLSTHQTTIHYLIRHYLCEIQTALLKTDLNFHNLLSTLLSQKIQKQQNAPQKASNSSSISNFDPFETHSTSSNPSPLFKSLFTIGNPLLDQLITQPAYQPVVVYNVILSFSDQIPFLLISLTKNPKFDINTIKSRLSGMMEEIGMDMVMGNNDGWNNGVSTQPLGAYSGDNALADDDHNEINNSTTTHPTDQKMTTMSIYQGVTDQSVTQSVILNTNLICQMLFYQLSHHFSATTEIVVDFITPDDLVINGVDESDSEDDYDRNQNKDKNTINNNNTRNSSTTTITLQHTDDGHSDYYDDSDDSDDRLVSDSDDSDGNDSDDEISHSHLS